MKRILPLFLLFTLAFKTVLSQNENDSSFVYFGQTDITIGSLQGIHPNFYNQEFNNFLNGDLRQSFRIKNNPFQFVGHLSNEKLRIGKPSYFRISYDANLANRISKLENRDFQNETQENFMNMQKELHEMEGKLSFKREQLKQLTKQLEMNSPTLDLPEVAIDSIEKPEFEGLNTEFDHQSIDLNNNNGYSQKAKDLSYLDSLSNSISEMSSLISTKKNQLDSLQNKLDEIKAMNISTYVPKEFKIQKVNIGLISLSSGGLSTNTIPIHGFRLEGTYRKTFYDLSAGLTRPFQNFTSQVFSQITNNTQNVFNLNQFYQASKLRLVESMILGYGNKYKSNLKVEQFYTGKSWESIKARKPEITNNTLNFSGNLKIERNENIDLGFLVGMSTTYGDSIETGDLIDRLAIRGTASYILKKLDTKIESEFRKLGGNYDGSSQGVLINGNIHKMIGFIQKIGSHSSVSMRYMEDEYSKTDSIVLFNNSKRWMSQMGIRINKTNKIQGSYTMIIGSGTEVSNRKGHMGTVFYVNEIKLGKNKLVSVAQGGYTTIPVRVSDQEIIQGSISSEYQTKKLGFALKGSYEQYSGIEQLYGRNYILEPTLKYTGKMGQFMATYQYCQSDQFDKDYGLVVRADFSPSQFLSYQLTAQKWLGKDRSFFFYQAPSYVAPWYVDVRVIVHLNVNR